MMRMSGRLQFTSQCAWQARAHGGSSQTFENRSFCTEDGESVPRGLDAAQFFIDALLRHGIDARYDDQCDFYAHTVDCRVRRRPFVLTIGFASDRDLMIVVDDPLPRFLTWIWPSYASEQLQLVETLTVILREHDFEGVRWSSE
jgi:hypothetical protein